jgi:hypothetical protein
MSDKKLFEIKLLNCPMCGNKAKIHFNDLNHNMYVARCDSAFTCGLRGSAFLNEIDAANAWNKRVTPQVATV